MKFCWVTIHVENLEKSLHFYQDILGLPLLRRFSSRGIVEIAMLGEEDMPKMELICNPSDHEEKSAAGISIGFEVASLDEAMEHMKSNRIQILGDPMSPNPSMRFCFVLDPDGHTVQLVENIR